MTETQKAIRGVALAVLLVGGAVVAAWWFTRTNVSVTAATQADEHAGHTGAAAPTSDGNPVTLTAGDARRLGVTYAKAERKSLSDEVRIVGIVSYDETRVKAIAPKVEGWVEQLDIAYPGQTVEIGASLLRIYSPMVVTVQEELLLATKLAADVSLAGDAKRNADALVAAARRRLRYWDIPDDEIARVERTGEVARTVTLRSPVRGVVVRLGVRAGQRIMAGEAVYEVADLGNVWLEGEVFDHDMASVRVGQTVTAEFASRPGESFHGRIAFVDPTVNPDTRTLRVRVTMPNPELLLKPGMYATLHVRGPARTVVQIPRSAVLVTGLRTFVFVLDDMGMLVPRNVTIGQTTPDRVEIISGLNAGETVVASATFLIDAESNLGAAVAAMANMPGMSDSPVKPPKQ